MTDPLPVACGRAGIRGVRIEDAPNSAARILMTAHRTARHPRAAAGAVLS
jgi:hypothetical protein